MFRISSFHFSHIYFTGISFFNLPNFSLKKKKHCIDITRDISYYLLKTGLYRCGKNYKLPISVAFCLRLLNCAELKVRSVFFRPDCNFKGQFLFTLQRGIPTKHLWCTLVYFKSLITFHPFWG